jgi:hypothetical protein
VWRGAGGCLDRGSVDVIVVVKTMAEEESWSVVEVVVVRLLVDGSRRVKVVVHLPFLAGE